MKINKTKHMVTKGKHRGKIKRNPSRKLSLSDIKKILNMIPPDKAKNFRAAMSEILAVKPKTKKERFMILRKHNVNPHELVRHR